MVSDVCVVARRAQPQYALSKLGWDRVKWILCDKREEERTGAWSQRLAKIEVDARGPGESERIRQFNQEQGLQKQPIVN